MNKLIICMMIMMSLILMVLSFDLGPRYGLWIPFVYMLLFSMWVLSDYDRKGPVIYGGLTVWDTDYFTLSGCTIYSEEYGVVLNHADYATVTNCQFTLLDTAVQVY